MDIRINDRFAIGCDEYNWILYDKHKFTTKDGEIKENTKTWYPSTLDYLCEIVIRQTPKNCETAKEILQAVEQAKIDCINALKALPENLIEMRQEIAREQNKKSKEE